MIYYRDEKRRKNGTTNEKNYKSHEKKEPLSIQSHLYPKKFGCSRLKIFARAQMSSLNKGHPFTTRNKKVA